MFYKSTVVETQNSKIGREMNWDNSPRDLNGRLLLRSNPMISREYDCHWKTLSSLVTIYGDYGISYDQVKEKTRLPFDPQIYGDNSYSREMTNEASLKFYEELNEVKLALGQIFAERRKTIAIIADATSTLAKFYFDLRRGRNPFRNGAKVNPRNAPNLWLEYSYGWIPLVSDVHDALNFHKVNEPKAKIRKKIRSRQVYNEGGDRPDYRCVVRSTDSVKVTYKVTVGAQVIVTDPGYGFLNQFDISNPLSLAWELLPYSFVVDWFIPVGDWLRVQNALAGVRLEQQYSTVHALIRVDSKREIIPDNLNPRVIVNPSSDSAVSSYIWKARQTRVPAIPNLSVMVDLDISKAISGLALLWQAFGRK